MVIGKYFAYIELHKTGCTHVRKILNEIYAGDCTNIGKHSTFKDLPQRLKGDFSSKLKIGNIRNPWDWYVSVWAYGCMKKGEVYNRIVYPENFLSIRGGKYFIKQVYRNKRLTVPNAQEWQSVYEDAMNPELFQQWLKMIFANETIAIAEDYGRANSTPHIGLLTYRHFFLYTYQGKQALTNFKSYEKLVAHDKQHNFIDYIIRNEALEKDLEKVLQRLGKQKAIAENAPIFQGRTNKSERRSFRDYYNQESIELVAQKEQFIIDKYGYQYS